MAPRHFMITLAIVAAAAVPAMAQDHNRRDNRAQSQQTAHSRREQPEAQRAQPQRAPERAPQQVYRAPEQVNRAPQQVYRAPQAVPTPQASRLPQAQRAPQVWQNERAVPRAVPQPQSQYRSEYSGRSYDGRSYDRGAYVNRGGYAEPRRYGYATPRIIRPTIVQVLPYRPYVYRPSWSIGVYYGADGYYPYGYTPDYYFNPIPGHYYGGLRITGAPREARVFADGYFVGIVDDFDGIFQHLNLEVGPHHIEIQLDGYAPVAFDVNVRPGQTITFRADPSFFQPIG